MKKELSVLMKKHRRMFGVMQERFPSVLGQKQFNLELYIQFIFLRTVDISSTPHFPHCVSNVKLK